MELCRDWRVKHQAFSCLHGTSPVIFAPRWVRGAKNDASDPKGSLVSVSSSVLDEHRCAAGDCLLGTGKALTGSVAARVSVLPTSYGIQAYALCQRPAGNSVPGSS